MRTNVRAIVGTTLLGILLSGCSGGYDPDVQDEAMAAGKTVDDYPTHPYDSYGDMDGGAEALKASIQRGLKPGETLAAKHEAAVKGRNTWMIWTAGNQAFWNYLSQHSYGVVDFLRMLDNRNCNRSDRLKRKGLINEPGMRAATKANRYGLWLDTPKWWPGGEWPPADAAQFDAFRKDNPEIPDPYVYGYSSGIVGLRIFPNPEFDDSAKRHWDGRKGAGESSDAFLTEPRYHFDPKLVRPYRIGMACSFCHVSHDPMNPPPAGRASEPEWANLSANIGSQYFKFGQVFAGDMKKSNVLWHVINSPEPGALDTSLLATDGNNNPNTMNAVFGLPARLGAALAAPRETVSQDTMAMPVMPGLGLPDGPERVVPHVLADGADSIGARGALCRVWLNIGEFHQEWIQCVNLMVGIKKQRPFKIKKARDRSINVQVTEKRSVNLATFFLEATAPKKLADAPGGRAVIDAGAAKVPLGKTVFGSHCFCCHSSKQPEGDIGGDGEFWDDPSNWKKWLRNADYLAKAQEIVKQPDFLDGNYLSTDQRYPVTDIGINICRSVADNGKAGRVWEDYTSDDYKNQPVLDVEVDLAHPYDPAKTKKWRFTADVGPGRVRPLSLISNWATAPFLHNNSVGEYPAGNDPSNFATPQEPDVSVAGRLATHDDSIKKLLGLKPRAGYASIVRTDVDTKLELPTGVLPDFLELQLGLPPWLLSILLILVVVGGLWLVVKGFTRWRAKEGKPIVNGILIAVGGILVVVIIWLKYFNETLEIGHIPSGTPVNLIANLNSPGWLEDSDRRSTFLKVARDMLKVSKRKLDSFDHEDVPDLVDNLWAINKCPDLVFDRGHDFGSKEIKDADGTVIMRELSVEEREALIEFLKTM